MKIGIYDPYLDDLGGGEKYMMTAAMCLSQQHNVDLFWDHKEDVEKLEQRFSIDFSKIKLKKNVFSPQVSTTDRLIETRKYDVIILLSDGSIPFTLSKKLFLHMQQPMDPNTAKNIKTQLKLKRVNAIFYNSEFSASFNRKVFPNVKSKVIYPPVGNHPEKMKKENIILHVGRFRVTNVKTSDYKKQQTMVDAFKKSIDHGLKGWKFVVATSIHDVKDPAFQKMIQSGKGYPIEFLINKTNKDLWHMYNKAKIYWHASGYGEDIDKHPEFAEHFGISTVEAMSAGAVPIVINAGGQPEIITHEKNGLLWNDLKELDKETNRLIKDHMLWERLSKAAQERAQDFTKETFCKAINQLVNE